MREEWDGRMQWIIENENPPSESGGKKWRQRKICDERAPRRGGTAKATAKARSGFSFTNFVIDFLFRNPTYYAARVLRYIIIPNYSKF